MNCETFLNQMDDFVDSTLPQATRAMLEEHLRLCASCREELRSLQSLLARAAALPRTVMPDRDLWPDISAGIAATGSSNNGSVPTRSVPDRSIGHNLHPEIIRWIWRLAAVAILGAMAVLAATYLRNHTPVLKPKAAVEPDDLVGFSRNQQSPAAGNTQAPTNDARPQQTEKSQPANGPALSAYEQACQCGPSAESAALVDKAWMVDESLAPQRARQQVSDQLYKLAGDNADNFFFHKAALDALSYPMHLASYMTERYRVMLAQHPGDPVAVYYYAYSLMGSDTPQMIRLMNQLTADHPEFPWPNLALAEVYGLFAFKNENKVKSSIQAFMKLCPESPEPTRMLVSIGNSDFLSDALKHMRANLAMHSDIQSLRLYQELWYLESLRRATGENFSKVRQHIQEDLKRLQSLDAAQQRQLAAVIRGGYFDIGDRQTFRDLFEKDTSSSGRWGAVSLEMQEWSAQNPLPAEGASAAEYAAYWENRLRMSDSWLKKMPESPALWITKLEALASLKSHAESEFFEVAEKALTLERDGSQVTRFPAQKWGSNILKLASLFGDRGVLLDQVPDLVMEGLAAAEALELESSTDFSRDRKWSSLMTRFSDWLEADDAWHSLAAAYLRVGRPDKASTALDNIGPALADFKSQLVAANEGFRPEDDVIGAGQRRSMADLLTAREKRYAAARASLSQALKK